MGQNPRQKWFAHSDRKPVKRCISGMLFLLLAACSNTDTPKQEDDSTLLAQSGAESVKSNTDAQPIDSNVEVLATVDGTRITFSDLETLLERVGGEQAMLLYGSALGDEKNRKNMVESLVNSRAMALSAEKSLTDSEKTALERQVQHYREELLVKRFLDEFADVQPVSNQMVKAYYQKHQSDFAEESQYRFEVLTSYGELTENQRTQLIQTLGKAKASSDWKSIEASLLSSQVPVRYQQAQARLSLLTEDLKGLLEKIPGHDLPQVSDLVMAERIKVVRLLEVIPGEQRPLSAVSDSIRKRLAPVMMKQAVSEASALAREQVEIHYP